MNRLGVLLGAAALCLAATGWADPNPATTRCDTSSEPAGIDTTFSFTAASDDTLYLGFVGCVATCTPHMAAATDSVLIQYLGDAGKVLGNGDLWQVGRSTNPRTGLPRISWNLRGVPSATPYQYGYGGLKAIRIKGKGHAGTVDVWASEWCSR